jgi:hypothetical protein
MLQHFLLHSVQFNQYCCSMICGKASCEAGHSWQNPPLQPNSRTLFILLYWLFSVQRPQYMELQCKCSYWQSRCGNCQVEKCFIPSNPPSVSSRWMDFGHIELTRIQRIRQTLIRFNGFWFVGKHITNYDVTKGIPKPRLQEVCLGPWRRVVCPS